MDKRKKAFFNLIISALLFFSALVVSVSSFGWFASNEQTKSSGMGTLLKVDETIVDKVQYYNVVEDSSTSPSTFTFDAVSADNAAMGMYNLLSSEYQMVVKIYLKENKTVSLTATTSTTYYLGSNEAFALLPASSDNSSVPQSSTATIDGKTVEYTNALSSVVSIAVVDQSSLVSSTNGFTYKSVTSSSGEYKTLIDKEAGTVNSSVDIATSVTPYDEGNSVYSVMIILDYDKDLISEVFSKNLANPVFSAGTDSVPFLCDFSVSVS